ncbi:MAG TPA: hypothetical protein VFO01_08290 [Trebonia sp.]|nr:hypothetical protein [Trebonia sp.]
MRHLYGIALAVGMTLAMFFGGAWGYLRLLKLPVPPGQASALPAGGGSLLSDSTALLALAALVATAVLAGVLAVAPRISPLASGVPGLLLLAWTALYFVSVRQAVRLIPLRSQAFGAGWEGLLFNGVLGAAGAVMVFPLFIPSRWRLSRQAETEAFARDVDEYLKDVTTDSRVRPERQAAQREDQPLVGTVLSRPAATRPADTMRVDTTHVTGASRALRNTGSFRMAADAQPQATGSTPSMPRRGSYRRPADRSQRGRPYDE